MQRYDVCCKEKFTFSDQKLSRIFFVDPLFSSFSKEICTDNEGFLRLSISQLEALWVAKVLRKIGVDAYPINEEYRKSRLRSDEAREIAKKYIVEVGSENKEYDYQALEDVTGAWWLNKLAFCFFSKSEKMALNDVSPPGLSLCVDRVSHKIMSGGELLHAELPIMIIE